MSTENTITAPETNSTPEDNGGKLFTQEQVNQIVSDRLTRERAKGEPTPIDQRERDIAARESRLTCREFIEGEGFPAGLLDILDTSDTEKFKGLIQRLDELLHLPSKNRAPAPFVKPTGKSEPVSGDAVIAAAFKPKGAI